MIFKAKVLKKNVKEIKVAIMVNDKNLKNLHHCTSIRYSVPRRFIKVISSDYVDIGEMFIFNTINMMRTFNHKHSMFLSLFNSSVDPKSLTKREFEIYSKFAAKRIKKMNRFLGMTNNKVNEK